MNVHTYKHTHVRKSIVYVCSNIADNYNGMELTYIDNFNYDDNNEGYGNDTNDK